MSRTPRSPVNELIRKLRQDVDDLADRARAMDVSPPARKKLNAEIERAAVELNALLAELDPIKRPLEVFDPGNPRTVGFFVALAMTAQQRFSLEMAQPIYGSGIYALYFIGDYPLYSPIRGTETPIYIGQAAPGTQSARTPVEQGVRLTARLNDHRRTIGKASDSLQVSDFEYRALVVQTGWESQAEAYLIRLFEPIWNKESKIVQGFGKHGDAPTTRRNKVSSWDVLHPGRIAAGIGVNPVQKTEATLRRELKDHFMRVGIYRTVGDVLDEFVRALRQG